MSGHDPYRGTDHSSVPHSADYIPEYLEAQDPVGPRVIDATASFVRCMADGTSPRRFGFQDPSPGGCLSPLLDEVRCAVHRNHRNHTDEACRRVAYRRRYAVNPNCGIWPPKPEYVSWLGHQRRLPYQVDAERRGIRVDVPAQPHSQRPQDRSAAASSSSTSKWHQQFYVDKTANLRRCPRSLAPANHTDVIVALHGCPTVCRRNDWHSADVMPSSS